MTKDLQHGADTHGAETLRALVAIHGTEVGARLDTMRPLQRQAIAEAAYDCGVIPVMEALNVPIASLEAAMRAAGFEKCEGECEAWFGAIELDEEKRCPDCATSDEFAERNRELKERDDWIESLTQLVGGTIPEEEFAAFRKEHLAEFTELHGQGLTVEQAGEQWMLQREPVEPSGN